jgi:hypothetical protein
LGIKCAAELIQQTSPVFLDGIDTFAIKPRHPMERPYCPWCWRQLAESECTYNYAHICDKCIPLFAAEYDSRCYHAWLCAQITCWDIARIIGRLLVSV